MGVFFSTSNDFCMFLFGFSFIANKFCSSEKKWIVYIWNVISLLLKCNQSFIIFMLSRWIRVFTGLNFIRITPRTLKNTPKKKTIYFYVLLHLFGRDKLLTQRFDPKLNTQQMLLNSECFSVFRFVRSLGASNWSNKCIPNFPFAVFFFGICLSSCDGLHIKGI